MLWPRFEHVTLHKAAARACHAIAEAVQALGSSHAVELAEQSDEGTVPLSRGTPQNRGPNEPKASTALSGAKPAHPKVGRTEPFLGMCYAQIHNMIES